MLFSFYLSFLNIQQVFTVFIEPDFASNAGVKYAKSTTGIFPLV